MISGGAKRGVCSRVSLHSKPRPMSASLNCRAPPASGVEVDGNQQAAAAHFRDHVGAQLLNLREEISALKGGILDHPFLDQHPQRGAANGAGQGVAVERAAVLARLEDTQHLGV